MQIFHERCYLTKKSIISYNLGFAASRLTFFAKLTAFRKTFESIMDNASSKAFTFSSYVPLANSSLKLSSPVINHDNALL